MLRQNGRDPIAKKNPKRKNRLDFRVQCVVSASSDLDPLFTDTYLLLCIAQALGQFFRTDYHLILSTTP